MNRAVAALETGVGIVFGAWLGASIGNEMRPGIMRDAGALIGGLVGGVLTSAAIAEPEKQTGVSGCSLHNPEFP